VTSSISSTPLDEMIVLVLENKATPRSFHGIRVVKFRDTGDILRQLTMAAGPASTLNPAATPFIPAQLPSQANGPEILVEAAGDEPNEDSATQVAAEEEDAELPEEGQEADVAAIIESIGTTFTGLSADVLAEQESAD
jgi:hypothetical protein